MGHEHHKHHHHMRGRGSNESEGSSAGACNGSCNGSSDDEVEGSLTRRFLSTTPTGQAALAAHDNAHQAKKLKKLSGSKNPRTASAAKTLAAAKKGDPKATAKIANAKKLAAKGDPSGKDAMKRLNAVNAATKPPTGIHALYAHGIT